MNMTERSNLRSRTRIRCLLVRLAVGALLPGTVGILGDTRSAAPDGLPDVAPPIFRWSPSSGVPPLFPGFELPPRGPEDELTMSLPTSSPRLDKTFHCRPLAFERNEGQFPPEVAFLARTAGYHLFLTPNTAIMRILSGMECHSCRSGVLRMDLIGANASAPIKGETLLPGKVNYFIGNQPDRWRTRISTFARVRYEEVYPGIDLVYYGNDRRLEYDFVLAPGADPNRIVLAFEGADEIKLETQGDLVLALAGCLVRWCRPNVFQEIAGIRREIPAEYVLGPASDPSSLRTVFFRLGGFDASRPLVIDPILVFSKPLGGTSEDLPKHIETDSQGNIYVSGSTGSADFPVRNAAQAAFAGSNDVFVSKFTPSGELAYSTYLGGADYDLQGNFYYGDLAVDASGSAYVTADTLSDDFPVVNAVQPYRMGSWDAYVAKLSPDGDALVYSTYLGGSEGDTATAVAVDPLGSAYVGGITGSSDFPVHRPLFYLSGTGGGFLTKLEPSGAGITYSTYLAGSVTHLVADAEGNAYASGNTGPDFPLKNPIQSEYVGWGGDGFLLKMNPDGSDLVFSTRYGGSRSEFPRGMALGPQGDIYIAFLTRSSWDFPTINAFQPVDPSSDYYKESSGALVRIKGDGSSVVYSTFLGGSAGGSIFGLDVDDKGNAYVGGMTSSTDFPLRNPIQSSFTTNRWSSSVGCISVVSPGGSNLLFSSYFSPVNPYFQLDLSVDRTGSAVLVGDTAGGHQPPVPGDHDAFITKLADLVPNSPFARITRSGAFISIFWPAAGNSSYVLEFSEALGPTANWSTGPHVPELRGEEYMVTVEITSGARFFRLKK